MDLENEKQNDYMPMAMLVVYQSGQNTYLETHEIVDGKPQPGKPISIQAVNEFFQDKPNEIIGFGELSWAARKS